MGASQSTEHTSTYLCLFYPLLLPISKLKRKCQQYRRQRKAAKRNKKLRRNALPRCSTFGSTSTLLTPTKKPINDANYEVWKTKLEHSLSGDSLAQHITATTPLSQRALIIQDTDTIISGQLTPKGFPAHTDKGKLQTPYASKARRKLVLPLLDTSPGVTRRKQMQRQMQHEKQQQIATSPPEQHWKPCQTIVTHQQTHSKQPSMHTKLNDSHHLSSLYYKTQLFCSLVKQPSMTLKHLQKEMRDFEDYCGTGYHAYYW